MTHPSILSRILWCRRFRRQAPTPSEKEGWRAEEQGLRDALLMRDHSNHYRSHLPDVFGRYVTGFQDAQTLIRMAHINRTLAQPRDGKRISPHLIAKDRVRREVHTNILIIEDGRPVRTPLCGVLESKHHQVFEVPRSLRGPEQYQERSADLIITDLDMPKMSDRPSLELTKDY